MRKHDGVDSDSRYMQIVKKICAGIINAQYINDTIIIRTWLLEGRFDWDSKS